MNLCDELIMRHEVLKKWNFGNRNIGSDEYTKLDMEEFRTSAKI